MEPEAKEASVEAESATKVPSHRQIWRLDRPDRWIQRQKAVRTIGWRTDQLTGHWMWISAILDGWISKKNPSDRWRSAPSRKSCASRSNGTRSPARREPCLAGLPWSGPPWSGSPYLASLTQRLSSALQYSVVTQKGETEACWHAIRGVELQNQDRLQTVENGRKRCGARTEVFCRSLTEFAVVGVLCRSLGFSLAGSLAFCNQSIRNCTLKLRSGNLLLIGGPAPDRNDVVRVSLQVYHHRRHW